MKEIGYCQKCGRIELSAARRAEIEQSAWDEIRFRLFGGNELAKAHDYAAIAMIKTHAETDEMA